MLTPNQPITCLYYGPIARKGEPAAGGYVAANRKNIDQLTAQGINVIELPYPDSKLSMIKKLTTLVSLPFRSVKYKGDNTVVHVTLLYKSFIYFEALIVAVAKIVGLKVVVDIRAGSFFIYYASRGFLYRRFVRFVLSHADAICVEGSKYIPQLRDILGSDKKIVYFPNVADCHELPVTERPTDKFNVIYFGAINKSKGCDVAIDAIDCLDDRFRLYLAGNIYDDDIKRCIDQNPKVSYLGMLSPAELKDTLRNMHFFIFPSKHIGEGQSNSLIESMSMGVVPVSSPQGFSAEVIDTCGAILPEDASASMYADAIRRIADNGYDAASHACRQHIVECHNVKTEITKIVELYRSLLCQ